MTLYDVGQSQADVLTDLQHFNKGNYTELLQAYSAKMQSILEANGGLESNVPLNSDYYKIRNKYQFVVSKFTKE